MDDQRTRIKKAVQLAEKGDKEGAKALIQSPEDLALFEETIAALHGGDEESSEPFVSKMAQTPIGSAAIGFADKVSFELSDEAYGAIKALLSPNDPRPFEDRYREAQREFAKASELAWEEHPVAYGMGAVPGVIANAAATAGAGLTSKGAMMAAGALTGAGAAKEGETAASALTGAAAVPFVDKVAMPVAKAAGRGLDKLTGGALSNASEFAKNRVLGANELMRTQFRKFGGKLKNLNDVSTRRAQLRIEADTKASELEAVLKGHIESTDAKIKDVLDNVDRWYDRKGTKAISGKEVAAVVQKYFKRLESQRDWISLNDAEKNKFLRVLRDLKERVLFKSDKDALLHADLRNAESDALTGAKSIEWREQAYNKAEREATEEYAKSFGGIEADVDSQLKRLEAAHNRSAQEIERGTTEKTAQVLGQDLYGAEVDDAILRELKELSGVSVKQMKKDQEEALVEGTAEKIAARMNKLDESTTAKSANIIGRGEVAKDAAAANVEKNLNKKLGDVDTKFGEKFASEIGQADVYGQKAESLYRDLSLADLNTLRAQLQEVTDAGSKVTLKPTSSGGFTGSITDSGGKITNPRIQKTVKDMEVEIRNLMDNRSDAATGALGLGQTWKELRNEQHQNLILRDMVPNVSEMKALADEGILSTKSAELAQFMNAKPVNKAHADLQSAWADAEPLFNEYSTLANLDPARKLSGTAELQFRTGAVVENLKQQYGKVASPLANNYVIPRAAGQVNALVDQIVGTLGDQMGLPAAIASEEIMTARETGDDASLEQYMGEVAPKMEGFFSPSPVMTSKGRARSAIVDRSGVRARIVDPMERNAIRDDVWKDNSMSIMEKSRKVDQLNKLEKVDLDMPETGSVQTYDPQGVPMAPAQELPPMDIYGAMNGK